MKKLLPVALLTGLCMGLGAQTYDALPDNPDPNKCYVRCITPDVYEDVDVDVEVAPGCKVLTGVDATKRTITEEVVIQEGYTRLVCDPPVWEEITVEYVREEACETVRVSPCRMVPGDNVEVVVMPGVSRWEYQPFAGCKSDDPRDCQVLCWRQYPPEVESVPTRVVGTEASCEMVPGRRVTDSYTKKVIKTPAQCREVEVPPVTRTITRLVKDQEARCEETTTPPTVITVSTKVLVEKGGLTVWEEIDCELLNYNALPINYEYGSANLTAQARRIIDENVLKLMQAKPAISIEIAAHTDSRGSTAANQNLSERRAQSVVRYLVSKGISSSRLVATGFGESRLKNRCADGVDCSEAEHAVNRRTEFRVIQNN